MVGGAGAGGGDLFGSIIQGITAMGTTTAAGVGSMLAASDSQDAAKAVRRWNRMMYETRYQKTVADMRAAGLNPILAIRGGGAGVGSVPGISQAQVPDYGRAVAAGAAAGAGLGQSFSSARQARIAEKQQQALLDLQQDTAYYQSRSAQEEVLSKRIQNDIGKQGLRQAEADTLLKLYQLPAARARMKFDESDAGQLFHYYSQPGAAALSTAEGAAKLFGGYGVFRRSPRLNYWRDRYEAERGPDWPPRR